MRVLVCGHRKLRDRDLVWQTLDEIHGKVAIEVVIHGCAAGADSFARQWAGQRGLLVEPFPAKWDDVEGVDPIFLRTGQNGRPYNAKAGPERNTRMLLEGRPDMVVAFVDSAAWRGTPGTNDMLRKARGLAANGWPIEILVKA